MAPQSFDWLHAGLLSRALSTSLWARHGSFPFEETLEPKLCTTLGLPTLQALPTLEAYQPLVLLKLYVFYSPIIRYPEKTCVV